MRIRRGLLFWGLFFAFACSARCSAESFSSPSLGSFFVFTLRYCLSSGRTRWSAGTYRRAAAGMRVVGVDADVGAIGICAMRDGVPASRFAGGQSERLPFRNDSFDLVYCFSVIEHVASVEASVSEMVRVTRPGGVVYVHTPNAWSWYEGHYKVFWVPFMPPPVARWYLALRGRPTAYLQTLRRLTPGRLRRAFAAAGVRHVEFHAGTAARETAGRLGPPVRLYYRLSGMSPFIEIVARKP